MALDEKYSFREIERKWQEKWRKADLFRTERDPAKPKYYALEFFPYPSGAGLSVGHFKNYAPTDAFVRLKSMQGYNVLHPMGWDAFGQPAENEAIKRQRQPSEMVREYAANYKRQLDLIGMAYDWNREINSSDPAYYRWTQWIFLQLLHRGLAYRKAAAVNWCPKDKTVLANEEVVNGRCWRCNSLVERKMMPQWYLKITAYAERLLADLDTVDWSEGIKLQQRNWIGRSEGAEVEFQLCPPAPTSGGAPVEGSPIYGGGGGPVGPTVTVFTTRPDTLWGATFMVLAPEHPLVEEIVADEQRAAVEAYRTKASRETDMDRQAEGREKTGVFTGAYATNPVNGERIPIWIADYVLMGYGTGAIMAVPAHDQRDFEFARKFGLPLVPVYQEPGQNITGAEMTQAIVDRGALVNSGPFDGLPYTKETVRKVAAWLEEHGTGRPVVTYRFRDWLLSRQRYWGVPIPIVHCPVHGEVPVQEEQLPVTLPPVENYQPSGTGESPLATIPEFVETTCPICGGPARRETDTMAGFACSSWYFLRFADPHNSAAAFERAAVDYWLPVDMYVGGAEHAVMHLLYARFWTKVLYDAGLVGFAEPFSRLRNQGSMLAWTPGRKPGAGDSAESEAEDKIVDWVAIRPEDIGNFPPDEIVYRWARMSKSKGNVVTPDEAAERFGADSLRVYEMFVAPFEENVQWSEEGILGSSKFLARMYRLIGEWGPGFSSDWRDRIASIDSDASRALRRKTHQTVAKVADDIENFRFNTAVAAMMEWVNLIYQVSHTLPSNKPSSQLTPPSEGKESSVNNEPNDGVGLTAQAKTSIGSATRSHAHPPAFDEALEYLVTALAPMAPHLADELWTEGLGQTGFLYRRPWPAIDADAARVDEITLVVQVNGKVRDKLTAPADSDNATLEALALASARVQEFMNGAKPRKVIVVPGKLVNIVV